MGDFSSPAGPKFTPEDLEMFHTMIFERVAQFEETLERVKEQQVSMATKKRDLETELTRLRKLIDMLEDAGIGLDD